MKLAPRFQIKRLALACSLIFASGITTAETLQEVYELALSNDPQRKADVAAYEAGKETVKISRANLLPTIRGTGSYSDGEGDTTGREFNFLSLAVTPVDRVSTSTSTGWRVTLNQPLFDMAAWYNYKQGSKRSDIAEANFGASQQSFIIRVAEAYINVLRAIDTIETTLAERRALESSLEQTKQRFEVGLTAITEVHEAQAQFDNTNANTLLAQGQLGIAFEALEVLTGQAMDSVAPITQDSFPVTNPTPADRDSWVNFSLSNNYNLQASKLNADASRYSALASKSAHLPTLSGSLSYSSDDSERVGQFGLSDTITDSNSVSLDLTIPIYSGGRVSAQRRQSYQQQIQAQEQFNRTQRETIQAARSLHLQVITGVSQVQARRQAIVSNQSALEATQAGYEVGTRNLVDVLQSQRNLYQAQRAYYTALYEYILNTLRLKETAGNLTPEDIFELNQYLDNANQVDRSNYEQ